MSLQAYEIKSMGYDHYLHESVYFGPTFSDDLKLFKSLIQFDLRIKQLAKKNKNKLFSTALKMLIMAYNNSNKNKLLTKLTKKEDANTPSVVDQEEDISTN